MFDNVFFKMQEIKDKLFKKADDKRNEEIFKETLNSLGKKVLGYPEPTDLIDKYQIGQEMEKRKDINRLDYTEGNRGRVDELKMGYSRTRVSEAIMFQAASFLKKELRRLKVPVLAISYNKMNVDKWENGMHIINAGQANFTVNVLDKKGQTRQINIPILIKENSMQPIEIFADNIGRKYTFSLEGIQQFVRGEIPESKDTIEKKREPQHINRMPGEEEVSASLKFADKFNEGDKVETLIDKEVNYSGYAGRPEAIVPKGIIGTISNPEVPAPQGRRPYFINVIFNEEDIKIIGEGTLDVDQSRASYFPDEIKKIYSEEEEASVSFEDEIDVVVKAHKAMDKKAGSQSEIIDYIEKNYPDPELNDTQFLSLLNAVFPTEANTYEELKEIFEMYKNKAGEVSASLKIKMASMITLEEGQFGWDYLIVNEDGRDILIQTDYDYPSVASVFGWNGDDKDIAGAQEFLDEHIGAVEEDPGYFDEEDKEASLKIKMGQDEKEDYDEFGNLWDSIEDQDFKDYVLRTFVLEKLTTKQLQEIYDLWKKDFPDDEIQNKIIYKQSFNKKADGVSDYGKYVSTVTETQPDGRDDREYQIPFEAKSIDELVNIKDEDFQEFLYSELTLGDTVVTADDNTFVAADLFDSIVGSRREANDACGLRMDRVAVDAYEEVSDFIEELLVTAKDVQSETREESTQDFNDISIILDGQKIQQEGYEIKALMKIIKEDIDVDTILDKANTGEKIQDWVDYEMQVREYEDGDIRIDITMWKDVDSSGEKMDQAYETMKDNRSSINSLIKIAVSVQEGEAWLKRYLEIGDYEYDETIKNILQDTGLSTEKKAKAIKERIEDLFINAKVSIADVDWQDTKIDMSDIEKLIEDYNELNPQEKEEEAGLEINIKVAKDKKEKKEKEKDEKEDGATPEKASNYDVSFQGDVIVKDNEGNELFKFKADLMTPDEIKKVNEKDIQFFVEKLKKLEDIGLKFEPRPQDFASPIPTEDTPQTPAQPQPKPQEGKDELPPIEGVEDDKGEKKKEEEGTVGEAKEPKGQQVKKPEAIVKVQLLKIAKGEPWSKYKPEKSKTRKINTAIGAEISEPASGQNMKELGLDKDKMNADPNENSGHNPEG